MSKDVKYFWIVIILVVSLYEINSWYGKRFCANTAIPVLCSKD